MRNAVGATHDVRRPFTDAPVAELQQFRDAVELVKPEVPSPCRALYSSYRMVLRRDTLEAEGLAKAYFNGIPSEMVRYAAGPTQQLILRYQRPANELESFLRERNRGPEPRIAVREDTCFLRSLNYGMGNF